MGVKKPEELSLEELEALLLSKRRQMTQARVRRIAEVEAEARRQRQADDAEDTTPPRSPETWRGAGGRDRYFRGARLQALAHRAAVGVSGRTPRDWALLIVEVAAFVGLVVIMAASYQQLQALNLEYRASQRERLTAQPAPAVEPTSVTPAPTLTRTPTPGVTVPAPTATHASSTATPLAAQDAVLTPTRTTSPTAGATPEATPTLTPPAELPGIRPERPIAAGQSHDEMSGAVEVEPIATSTPRATPAPGMPVRLVIPAIEVDAPVEPSDDWESLKLGVGHRKDSGKPGEARNVVLSAHNDIYGEIFRYLHQVKAGDAVRVYTPDGHFDYVVDWVEIVLPTRVDLIEPGDQAILTLITCYPYLLDTHRVVVRASLVQ